MPVKLISSSEITQPWRKGAVKLWKEWNSIIAAIEAGIPDGQVIQVQVPEGVFPVKNCSGAVLGALRTHLRDTKKQYVVFRRKDCIYISAT